MAGREDGREVKRAAIRDREFIEYSHLSYMIPFAAEPELGQVLKPGLTGSRRSPFKSIEQREWLFFDESVDVYLILRTPYRQDGESEGDDSGKKALRAQLARVSLALEVHVVNSHVPGRDTPPAMEAVYGNVAVEDGREPDLLIDERLGGGDGVGGDDADNNTVTPKERYAFAVWKVPVFIARPRIRLQAPAVVFAASAHLRASSTDPESEEEEEGEDDGESLSGVSRFRKPRNGYLQSRAPAGLNLLESFGSDPAMGGVMPQLSAQRVSHVAPVTQSRDQLRPIKGLKSLHVKVFPAVHTRVKFARPNTVPASAAIIAMLEIDFTPYFDCEVILNKITMNIASGGVVTDLNAAREGGLSLPLHCVAHDHVTFLYRLSPADIDLDSVAGAAMHAAASTSSAAGLGLQQLQHQPPPTTRDLDIAIDVTALLRPGVCTPRLTMAWTTALDFTPPVNPGFGSSNLTPPLQRSHRPSQLSIDGAASLVAPAVSRPDSLPGLEAAAARSKETIIPDFGVTITFTAPTAPVHAGDEFCWSVFVVNRSSGGTPALGHGGPAPSGLGIGGLSTGPLGIPPIVGAARKLALRVIPKRRRNEVRVVRPPSARPQQPQRFHLQSNSLGKIPPGRPNGHDDESDPQQVADAVLDENIVHAMQRSSLVDSPELVSLTSEARVGPLAPGACHVVDLRFLALQEGIASVEAVRVVDLGSQEHVDVRELPVVVVEPRMVVS